MQSLSDMLLNLLVHFEMKMMMVCQQGGRMGDSKKYLVFPEANGVV